MNQRVPVRTAARLRPLQPQQGSHSCLTAQGHRLMLSASPVFRQFELPLLFGPRSSQQQVFSALMQPLVEDLFEGFSCAFLSCGPNVSGKSYTIEGGDSQETKGMIGRLADYLSLKLQALPHKGIVYLMRVSYVQVYEEEIIDLLEVRRNRQPGIVERGREVEFTGVGLKHLSNISDMEDFFEIGSRKRKFAYKKNRRKEQKSTGIFTIHLESCRRTSGEQLKKGKMHIIDMCASRICPEPLKHHYDLSANALKNVAHALVFGSANSSVPYHDSIVTLLLREHLGGLGTTSVLFHLSPLASSIPATLEAVRMVRVMGQIQNNPSCLPDPSQATLPKRLAELEEILQQLTQVEEQQKQLRDALEIVPEEADNEFLTGQFVRENQTEQLQKSLQRLSLERVALRKKRDNLESLFLRLPNHPAPESRAKYQQLAGGTRAKLLEISTESRAARQEFFQLQKQFQQERDELLRRIRELEGQYQFFRKVTQQTVRREQLDILRGSSLYDRTKRTYQVPQFAVRNKKLSLADSYSTPNKSLGTRTFMMSARSLKKCDSLSSSKAKPEGAKAGIEVRKEYFGVSRPGSFQNKREPAETFEREVSDEYEMGGFRDKVAARGKKGASSTSTLFKHLNKLNFK